MVSWIVRTVVPESIPDVLSSSIFYSRFTSKRTFWSSGVSLKNSSTLAHRLHMHGLWSLPDGITTICSVLALRRGRQLLYIGLSVGLNSSMTPFDGWDKTRNLDLSDGLKSCWLWPRLWDRWDKFRGILITRWAKFGGRWLPDGLNTMSIVCQMD